MDGVQGGVEGVIDSDIVIDDPEYGGIPWDTFVWGIPGDVD